jgi:putative SOS response-associated peptidase YedK
MCGRFSATFSFRDVKVRWNIYGDISFEARYNIAPSQEVPVILRNEHRNEIKLMRWGLVPAVGARSFHWSAHDYRSC